MSLTVNTDTYVSLTDANTYIAENYVSTSTEYTTWDALSDGDKEIYLKKSTKKLDRQILRGIKAVSTQTLEFPRALHTNTYRDDAIQLNIVVYNDWAIESEVSQMVKDAQVEEALAMSVSASTASSGATTRAKLQSQGVKSFKIGDLEEEYGNGLSSSYNLTVLESSESKELLKYYLTSRVPIC